MDQGNQLVTIPRSFPASTVPEFDLASRLKFRSQSPGQRRGIAPELMPSLEKTVYGQTGPVQGGITYSRVTKWMPRGSNIVPTSITVPTVLINETVPNGSQYWLEQYAFNLSSTVNENNYYWTIFINGLDVLNYGTTTQYPGRPVQSPLPVPLGWSKDQQILVGSGASIRVVVVALNPLASADICSATLIGSLEGVQS